MSSLISFDLLFIHCPNFLLFWSQATLLTLLFILLWRGALQLGLCLLSTPNCSRLSLHPLIPRGKPLVYFFYLKHLRILHNKFLLLGIWFHIIGIIIYFSGYKFWIDPGSPAEVRSREEKTLSSTTAWCIGALPSSCNERHRNEKVDVCMGPCEYRRRSSTYRCWSYQQEWLKWPTIRFWDHCK